jgi:transketolase
MVKGKPTVVIAHTIKGKGVSFMENDPEWHGKAPKPAEAIRGIRELFGGGTLPDWAAAVVVELEALEAS